MKSQILILFFAIIGACFIRPTYQYRLSKRELTEYDLTNFIVNTCSADKTDMIIQNLCDQTLQSALMGNFPFLIYYCTTVGASTRYCNSINQHTVTKQNAGAKRFIYRRSVRNINEDKKLGQKGQEMNVETDLEQKLIKQVCITKTEKSLHDMDKFCTQILHEIQQGRHSDIVRLCMYHPDFDYCQRVRSYASSFSWPLSKSSTPLSLVTHSSPSDINRSFVSQLIFKPTLIETNLDQQRINETKQTLT